jgi:hypothetical protein
MKKQVRDMEDRIRDKWFEQQQTQFFGYPVESHPWRGQSQLVKSRERARLRRHKKRRRGKQ